MSGSTERADVQTIREALEQLKEASLGWSQGNAYERAYIAAVPALDSLAARLRAVEEARVEDVARALHWWAIRERRLDDLLTGGWDAVAEPVRESWREAARAALVSGLPAQKETGE